MLLKLFTHSGPMQCEHCLGLNVARSFLTTVLNSLYEDLLVARVLEIDAMTGTTTFSLRNVSMQHHLCLALDMFSHGQCLQRRCGDRRGAGGAQEREEVRPRPGIRGLAAFCECRACVPHGVRQGASNDKWFKNALQPAAWS